MTFDDSALSRHPELKELRDLEEKTAGNRSVEVQPELHRLDGTIGCMVNGAGLVARWTSSSCQVASRRTSGRGWWCEHGTDSQCVQDSDVGHERPRGVHQHFRRHPAVDILAEGVIAAVKG
jgi:hypothetical protein